MNRQRQHGISIILVLIVVAVLAVGYFGYQSQAKRKELDDAMAQLNEQAKLWDDANRVAAATSRIALPTQINHMQAIKRNVEALTLPACMRDNQNNLSNAMDAAIQGYLAFMANTNGGGEAAAAVEFERAKDHMRKFQTVKAKC